MYEVTVTDESGQPHGLDTQDKIKEAYVGESILFAALGGTISELVSYDPEDSSMIDGATFTAPSPGTYRLRCVATNGTRQILVRVVERAVVAHVAAQFRTVGHGDSFGVATDAKVRQVVRALANHAEFFDGTLASLENKSLASYGC